MKYKPVWQEIYIFPKLDTVFRMKFIMKNSKNIPPASGFRRKYRSVSQCEKLEKITLQLLTKPQFSAMREAGFRTSSIYLPPTLGGEPFSRKYAVDTFESD